MNTFPCMNCSKQLPQRPIADRKNDIAYYDAICFDCDLAYRLIICKKDKMKPILIV